MDRLAVLGGGRMGQALVGGLRDAGWDADELAVAEVDPEQRRVLEERFPGVRMVPSTARAVADADVVVIATKPADVATALGACIDSLGSTTLVVSLAAGVSLADLERMVPGRPVVRAMPNVGALVRRGAAAVAGGTHADDADLATAERILGAVGTVVRLPEHQLDAVTAVSGSGPAYVFLLAEAMIEAAERAGLARPVADALVRQTLLGAATLLDDPGESPETLRAAVTSPGGTTAAALRVLEARGVRGAVLDAVLAAAARAAELGDRSPGSDPDPRPEEP